MPSTAGSAFFRHIKHRRAPALINRSLRALDSGQFAVPLTYHIMFRFPAEEVKNAQSMPLKLRLPEERLMLKFYNQHPEAKLEPVALQSFAQPLAKAFALRQLQLMRNRLSESEAFSMAQQEFQAQLQTLQSRRGDLSTSTRLMQQHDETNVLADALEHAALRRGGA